MEKNSTILEACWLEGSTDFQQRIPQPSVAGIAATVKALFEPFNRPLFNQFMDMYINRIAYTYVHNKTFENPFSIFKRTPLPYGATVAEAAMKFIRAHSYKDDWGDRVDDVENLLKVHRPDGSVAYHTVNRKDTYPISINTMELRAAFNSDDGLNNLVASIMQIPYNSDNYDEYRIFLELLSFYEHNHGFYKHQLSAVPNDEATGKEFLRAVRTYAGRFRFPSSLYNALSVKDIPVWVNADEADELVLLLTPEVESTISVDTLAGLFNVDLAEIKFRKLIVDNIPIKGAVALLTTSDFFVCADYAYEVNSFFNPQTLTENYYLTHVGLYSVSPFVPAVLFTTEAGTDVGTIEQFVSGLKVTPSIPASADGKIHVKRDETLTFDVDLLGTLVPDAYVQEGDMANLHIAPDAVTWNVILASNDLNPVPISQSGLAWVDDYNALHISDQLEDGSGIILQATAAYVNPSGTTTPFTSASFAVVVEPSGEGEENNTYLASLTIGNLTLTPAFDGMNVFEYTATTTASSNAVTAVAQDNNADVDKYLNGTFTTASSMTWSAGVNTLEIKVHNDPAERTYTVKVTKS